MPDLRLARVDFQHRRDRTKSPPYAPRGYISPSFIFPASLIIAWFHGGSHTSSTSASLTPGTLSTFDFASAAMVGPMPQPGAVRVIFTSTFAPAPARGVMTQS